MMCTSSHRSHAYGQQPSPLLHVVRLAPHYLPLLLPDLDSHPLLGYGEIHVINLVCEILVRRRSASYRLFIKCWLVAQCEISDSTVRINAETPVSSRGVASRVDPVVLAFACFVCHDGDNCKSFFFGLIALAVVPKDN